MVLRENVLHILFWKILEALLGGTLLEVPRGWVFKGHAWTLVSFLSLVSV